MDSDLRIVYLTRRYKRSFKYWKLHYELFGYWNDEQKITLKYTSNNLIVISLIKILLFPTANQPFNS
jgi:hypothetical protein